MDQLSRLDVEEHEINRLERELVEATVHRINVRWELERILENNAVLYRTEEIGIHSLPVEILVNIFYELLLIPHSGSTGRLMAVCRQWQLVILNTPLLWSVIHVNVPSRLDKLDILITYCQNSVQRSASIPLDISLYFPEMKPEFHSITKKEQKDRVIQRDDPCLRRFLKRLSRNDSATFDKRIKAHHLRWKKILQILMGDIGEVMGRWNSFECDFFCKQRGHNPILAFLEWDTFDYSASTLEKLVEERLSQIPRIMRKTAPPLLPGSYVCRLPNVESMVNLDGFGQYSIRNLVYSWKDPNLLRFMLTLHSLTHLHIEFFNTQRVDPRFRQEAIINSDKELNIIQGTRRDFWALLEAPNLESLTLTHFSSTLFLPVPIIVNYTFPSLKRVVIIQHHWSLFLRTFLDFLHELIRHAPRLTSIQCNRRQEFVSALTRYSCRTVYLSPSDIRPSGKVVEGEEGVPPRSIRTLDILTLLED
jgi:hypothetical protein